MDILKLGDWTRKKIAGIVIPKIIKKKLGVTVKVNLNDLEISPKDGKQHFHIDIEGEMTPEEYDNLVSEIFKNIF